MQASDATPATALEEPTAGPPLAEVPALSGEVAAGEVAADPDWKRPENVRWLGACLFGLILATLVGGFSAAMAVVLVVVFLTGAALIALAG